MSIATAWRAFLDKFKGAQRKAAAVAEKRLQEAEQELANLKVDFGDLEAKYKAYVKAVSEHAAAVAKKDVPVAQDIAKDVGEIVPEVAKLE